jgi:hypothetical protein
MIFEKKLEEHLDFEFSQDWAIAYHFFWTKNLEYLVITWELRNHHAIILLVRLEGVNLQKNFYEPWPWKVFQKFYFFSTFMFSFGWSHSQTSIEGNWLKFCQYTRIIF